MDPRDAMKKRLEARRAVQKFFEARRKALKVGPIWDFSLKNRIKREVLAELNGIARDLEYEAMRLAERGEDWQGVFRKARSRMEKLREDVRKRFEFEVVPGKNTAPDWVEEILRALEVPEEIS